MNNFKFRAWNLKTKTMEYPSSLYWFEENGVKDWGGESNSGGGDYNLMMCYGDMPKIGLPEIYESDLLADKNGVFYTVQMIDNFVTIMNFGIGCLLILHETSLFLPEGLKKIGNIYENQNLIIAKLKE